MPLNFSNNHLLCIETWKVTRIKHDNAVLEFDEPVTRQSGLFYRTYTTVYFWFGVIFEIVYTNVIIVCIFLLCSKVIFHFSLNFFDKLHVIPTHWLHLVLVASFL